MTDKIQIEGIQPGENAIGNVSVDEVIIPPINGVTAGTLVELSSDPTFINAADSWTKPSSNTTFSFPVSGIRADSISGISSYIMPSDPEIVLMKAALSNGERVTLTADIVDILGVAAFSCYGLEFDIPDAADRNTTSAGVLTATGTVTDANAFYPYLYCNRDDIEGNDVNYFQLTYFSIIRKEPYLTESLLVPTLVSDTAGYTIKYVPPEAPTDGVARARRDAAWVEVMEMGSDTVPTLAVPAATEYVSNPYFFDGAEGWDVDNSGSQTFSISSGVGALSYNNEAYVIIPMATLPTVGQVVTIVVDTPYMSRGFSIRGDGDFSPFYINEPGVHTLEYTVTANPPTYFQIYVLEGGHQGDIQFNHISIGIASTRKSTVGPILRDDGMFEYKHVTLEAPMDGKPHVRKDGEWLEITNAVIKVPDSALSVAAVTANGDMDDGVTGFRNAGESPYTYTDLGGSIRVDYTNSTKMAMDNLRPLIIGEPLTIRVNIEELSHPVTVRVNLTNFPGAVITEPGYYEYSCIYVDNWEEAGNTEASLSASPFEGIEGHFIVSQFVVGTLEAAELTGATNTLTPSDGKTRGRKNDGWVEVPEVDTTDLPVVPAYSTYATTLSNPEFSLLGQDWEVDGQSEVYNFDDGKFTMVTYTNSGSVMPTYGYVLSGGLRDGVQTGDTIRIILDVQTLVGELMVYGDVINSVILETITTVGIHEVTFTVVNADDYFPYVTGRNGGGAGVGSYTLGYFRAEVVTTVDEVIDTAPLVPVYDVESDAYTLLHVPLEAPSDGKAYTRTDNTWVELAGATDTFTSNDGKTVTVVNGLITTIV